MLSIFIFIAVILSESFFCAYMFKWRFEDTISSGCVGCILVLFVFGVFEHLLMGFYLILLAASCVYILFAILLIKNCISHDIRTFLRDFCECFFTPAFLIFSIFIILSMYCNGGRLVSFWDEFTHWATAVKQMLMIDALNSSSNAIFLHYKYYLPGTVIFQYLIEKIVSVFSPDTGFSEWRLFFANNILMFSFVVGSVRKISIKKIGTWFYFLTILLLPMVVYPEAYTLLCVDQLMGVVSAFVFFDIINTKKKQFQDYLRVLFSIAMMVLVKSPGVLFAVFASLELIISEYISEKENKKKFIIVALLSIAAVLLPKILWQYSLKLNGVVDDAGIGFNYKSFLDLLSGKEQPYRITVLHNYLDALLRRPVISFAQVNISSAVVVVLFSIFLFLLSSLSLIHENRLVISIFVLQHLCYILGLCLTYMYHFAPYEAIGLASFERYIGMSINSLVIASVFCVSAYITERRKNNTFGYLIILAIIILLTPKDKLKSHLNKTDMDQGYVYRGIYAPFCEKITEITEENSKIYLVLQATNGYGYWMCRYDLMPRISNPLNNTANSTWSLGESFFDGDRFTRSITADEWKDELKDTCDYVALIFLNDYFYDNYSSVFESYDEIGENRLYRINKQTGMLNLVYSYS